MALPVAAPPGPEPEPGEPEAGSWARSSGDDPASRMLLLFFRLLGPRRQAEMPAAVRRLLVSGHLGPRHLRALAVITMAGPMTVSEVARQEGLALSTASLLVTQLADAGLVERHEDSTDRRRTVVSVAPEFRRESWAVLDSKLAPLRRALDRMGPRQTEVLLRGLGILMEEVSRTEDDGGDDGGTEGKTLTDMTLHPSEELL